MKPRAWFRLHSDAVDDEKLGLLAFEDRWHYMALLCCKAKGLLDDEHHPELMRRKVAHKLGLSLPELDNVARRLAEVGLVDFDSLQPSGWDARQYESDSSTERTRAHRERSNGLKRHGDDAVTAMERHKNVPVAPPETETKTETERDEHAAHACDLRVEDRPPGKSKSIPTCPHTEVLKLWAEVLPALPQHMPSQWRGAREKNLSARWRETAAERGWTTKAQGLEFMARMFAFVGRSAFLTGRAPTQGTRPPFLCELAWLVKPDNWAGTLEGKYA
jgi:hypothetical protein